MRSGFSTLNLLMQFPDIISNCQKYALGFYIRLPSVSKSLKSRILFQVSQTSFCLDTPIYPEQDSFLAGNSLQIFFPVLVELLGNIQILRPVFEWDFTVIPFNTLVFEGTFTAVFTTVDCCFSLIFCFFLSLSD